MPSAPSVVAIIAAYNEADIIDTVVSDLVSQDVQVYFLDDGSTDGTADIVARHDGRGVIGIERLPQGGADERGFAWERILCRKAQLACELNADWFIHHDADEFRESPWPRTSLRDGIAWVDRHGFNAIDFVCLDFWPDREVFEDGRDVRDVFTRYAPAAPYDRVQIRCWKKTAGPVDLVASGGHEARFEARRVFPVRFILRHYPIRGQQHGERKVFHERQFLDAERERGWHVQYDAFRDGRPFLHDPSTLEPYDPDAVRLSLTLRHRGVEELEERLASARADLDGRIRDLDARNTELETLTRELESQRQAVAEKTADTHRLAADRERLTRALAAKTAESDAQTRELAAKTGEIEAQTRALAAKTAESDAQTRALAAQTAEIEAQTRELAAKTAEIDTHTREIGSLTGALDSKAQELARQQTALAVSARDLSQTRSALAQSQVLIERARRELAVLAEDVRSLRSHVEKQGADLAAANATIDRVQRGYEDRGRELEAFRRSLSWRWTAPARALYRLLTGRP